MASEVKSNLHGFGRVFLAAILTIPGLNIILVLAALVAAVPEMIAQSSTRGKDLFSVLLTLLVLPLGLLAAYVVSEIAPISANGDGSHLIIALLATWFVGFYCSLGWAVRWWRDSH